MGLLHTVRYQHTALFSLVGSVCADVPVNSSMKNMCYLESKMNEIEKIWKQIDQIEAVQRRFTKKLNGLKSMSYEQRLNALNTESLELRRLKLDLVLMFKISRGYIAIDNKIINSRTDSHIRGDFKVFKPHCKVNARAFSFAARHVNCWNALPNSVT